ncbi:MAG: hypothetical protein SF069_12480 [Phycisphaerae bacterium]|nr:hypothetical protein [Phycisphaerae bacterium]
MFQIWLQLIQLGAFVLLGLAFFSWYRRGRRVGDAPHCVRCDYDLSDGERQRCTECGADLGSAGAITAGELQRPMWRLVAAGVCGAAAMSVGAAAFWQYAYGGQAAAVKPLAKLLQELSEPPRVMGDNSAYEEIARRIKFDGLATMLPEIERHLRARAAGPPEAGALTLSETDLFDRMFRQRELTHAGDVEYCRLLTEVDIRIPPVVLAGDKVVIMVEQLRDSQVRRWIRFWINPAAGSPIAIHQAQWQYPGPYSMFCAIDLPIGDHQFPFEVTQKVAPRYTEKEPDDATYVTLLSNLTRSVRVVEPSAFDRLMEAALADLIDLPVWADHVVNRPELLVRLKKPCPLDGTLAFDLKDGERRRPIGAIDLSAGQGLPLAARFKSSDFHESSAITLWARFTPAANVVSASGEAFAAREYGPFRPTAVRTLRVRKVLLAELPGS